VAAAVAGAGLRRGSAEARGVDDDGCCRSGGAAAGGGSDPGGERGRRAEAAAVGAVLTFPTALKIYLALEPVEMRKQFNGLWSLAQERLEEDPRQWWRTPPRRRSSDCPRRRKPRLPGRQERAAPLVHR
jgi:hypothetical protein